MPSLVLEKQSEYTHGAIRNTFGILGNMIITFCIILQGLGNLITMYGSSLLGLWKVIIIIILNISQAKLLINNLLLGEII